MKHKRFKNEKEVYARTHISIETHYIDVPGPMHLHEFYELEIVLSGSGYQNLNGNIYSLQPGTAFLLTPVDFHSITPNKPMAIQNLSFDPCMLSSEAHALLINGQHDMVIQANDQQLSLLQLFIDLLSKECDSDDRFSLHARQNFLELLLFNLIRDSKDNHLACSSKAQIDASLRYIFSHFTEDLKLTEVAAQSGYTPNYFSKVFHETCGTSFLEFLTTLRINYAKMLLLSTSLSTTEIAENCGFASASGFFRRFQQSCGCTPTCFRKKNKSTT